ncbi:MAG TPA: FecR domain-containing protein, partial [Terriglobia bacterium]|nr:FecR domain-containing protein [Terriglobia bacterium]
MSPLAIAAFLLVQNVISIKPGFVHFADGKSNVQKFEQLKPGSRVQTEADGRVEIGLGPDSLLRVDENSAVVMRLLDSADVSILLESGTALVEVETLDKPNRIRVETGDLNTLITSSGTFRFSSNTVSVL